MASLNPRWNVSGTYMQVLPTFISTDSEGGGEKEFLLDYFQDTGEMLSLIFLKGYQWTFDTSKIFGGSSIIDLLVYQETVLRGRRVYLDYRRNPCGNPIPYETLSKEALEYLKNAGVLCGETPFERLRIMNESAITFYRDHHVDLEKDWLEIAVCAQHNNGGISTDHHWETDVQGLFAVGELCGSHGVTRPGGTALNAGQVGAMRATEQIHLRKIHGELPECASPVERMELRSEARLFTEQPCEAHGTRELNEIWLDTTQKMSSYGGIIRSENGIKTALAETNRYLSEYNHIVKRPSENQLSMYFRLRDMLVSRKVYLAAMLDYAQHGAGSRDSALYTDPNGDLPDVRMPELFRCCLDSGCHDSVIQEIALNGENCEIIWRPVRPMPKTDYFFENQWREYRRRERI